MSTDVKHYGLNVITETPGSNIGRRSDGTVSSLTLTGTYDLCAANIPPIGSTITGFPGYVEATDLKRLEGGMGEIAVTLSSSAPEAAETTPASPPVYSVSMTGTSFPLETHPIFRAETGVNMASPVQYRRVMAQTADEQAAWKRLFGEDCEMVQTTVGAAIQRIKSAELDARTNVLMHVDQLGADALALVTKFFALWDAGTTSYEAAYPILRKTSESSIAPQLGKTGFVDTGVTGQFGTLAPKTPDGAAFQYLKTSDSADRTGRWGKIRRVEEWKGSLKWDTELYTTGSSSSGGDGSGSGGGSTGGGDGSGGDGSDGSGGGDGGGSGGLTAVAHDGTLDGDGTAATPLKVVQSQFASPGAVSEAVSAEAATRADAVAALQQQITALAQQVANGGGGSSGGSGSSGGGGIAEEWLWDVPAQDWDAVRGQFGIGEKNWGTIPEITEGHMTPPKFRVIEITLTQGQPQKRIHIPFNPADFNDGNTTTRSYGYCFLIHTEENSFLVFSVNCQADGEDKTYLRTYWYSVGGSGDTYESVATSVASFIRLWENGTHSVGGIDVVSPSTSGPTGAGSNHDMSVPNTRINSYAYEGYSSLPAAMRVECVWQARLTRRESYGSHDTLPGYFEGIELRWTIDSLQSGENSLTLTAGYHYSPATAA